MVRDERMCKHRIPIGLRCQQPDVWAAEIVRHHLADWPAHETPSISGIKHKAVVERPVTDLLDVVLAEMSEGVCLRPIVTPVPDVSRNPIANPNRSFGIIAESQH